MTDGLHVYYDELVTALATVGIDIGPDSGVRDVRMDPKGITTVRMVRGEAGKGWQTHDDNNLLVEDWYELRHDRSACTCVWTKPSPTHNDLGEPRPTWTDLSCRQHGTAP